MRSTLVWLIGSLVTVSGCESIQISGTAPPEFPVLLSYGREVAGSNISGNAKDALEKLCAEYRLDSLDVGLQSSPNGRGILIHTKGEDAWTLVQDWRHPVPVRIQASRLAFLDDATLQASFVDRHTSDPGEFEGILLISEPTRLVPWPPGTIRAASAGNGHVAIVQKPDLGEPKLVFGQLGPSGFKTLKIMPLPTKGIRNLYCINDGHLAVIEGDNRIVVCDNSGRILTSMTDLVIASATPSRGRFCISNDRVVDITQSGDMVTVDTLSVAPVSVSPDGNWVVGTGAGSLSLNPDTSPGWFAVRVGGEHDRFRVPEGFRIWLMP